MSFSLLPSHLSPPFKCFFIDKISVCFEFEFKFELSLNLKLVCVQTVTKFMYSIFLVN